MEVRWMMGGNMKMKIPFPVYISTNPKDMINNPSQLHQLQQLYASCNHSPSSSSSSSSSSSALVVVDPTKLRLALSRSSVVVSVFRAPTPASSGLGGLLQRLLLQVPPCPPPPGGQGEDRELVAFGRAVSDMGLTASIYDVMVTPSLRRMGIGKMVVRRILRMLTSRDIYDIAALCCSPEQTSFFQACGFGDDMLGATTMMLTDRGPSLLH